MLRYAGVLCLDMAVSTHGACVWCTAITDRLFKFISMCGFTDFDFIVTGYNCSDITHAAVA